MNSFEQFKQALSEGNQQTIIEHANTIKKSILRNQYPLDVACQFYELYLPWCCMYDTEAVERNYKQYHAFCANDSNEERRHMLKSLYFMNLLANNNLSAFHCEIELLTESEMSNPYISFTLDLERSLSEGNYNKVLNSFGNFPLESYKGFINKMIETVRNDIDECIFASYNSLDLNTLQKFFYFNNNSPVGRFRPWPIRLALARGRITLPREARVEARGMRQPEN